jgi:hypothetical protein
MVGTTSGRNPSVIHQNFHHGRFSSSSPSPSGMTRQRRSPSTAPNRYSAFESSLSLGTNLLSTHLTSACSRASVNVRFISGSFGNHVPSHRQKSTSNFPTIPIERPFHRTSYSASLFVILFTFTLNTSHPTLMPRAIILPPGAWKSPTEGR